MNNDPNRPNINFPYPGNNNQFPIYPQCKFTCNLEQFPQQLPSRPTYFPQFQQQSYQPYGQMNSFNPQQSNFIIPHTLPFPTQNIPPAQMNQQFPTLLNDPVNQQVQGDIYLAEQVQSLRNLINELQLENNQLKLDNNQLKLENNQVYLENNQLQLENNQLKQEIKQIEVLKALKEPQKIEESQIFESQTLQNEEIPEIKCQHADHGKSQITGICRNDNCKKNRLVCKFCVRKIHNLHAEDIRDLGEYFWSYSEELKKYEKIKSSFDQVCEKLMVAKQFLHTLSPGPLVKQSYLTSQDIITQIKKYIKLKKLNKLFSDVHFQLIDEVNKLFEKINKKTIKNVRLNSSKFYFSYVQKHQKCNISDMGNIAILNDGQGIVICEPQLYMTCKTTIRIKIIECGSVQIGIGGIDKLQKVEYDPDFKQLGHGTFLIDEQGYAYSHNDKDYNSVEKSFKFQAKDEIKVEINKKEKFITWTKLKTNDSFTMKYQLEGELHFLVGLKSSSVEIINEE